jgi:squalene-hopene/tetraprenyl-beta-curcumene cyclase
MVNANEALALLGYEYEHPYREQCRQALRGLLVEEGERAWCQPCASPVWDTVLATLAMQEDANADQKSIRRALDWLVPLQILDAPADWKDEHPGLAGGGWAFQYANPHYPDLDDTAAVAWAMYQADPDAYRHSLERASDWLTGMQSSDGGFAAFDADNTCYYLNEIPFADHGALLDPPTSDVSARCTGFLALYGKEGQQDAMNRGLDYLLSEQEPSGAWFGRWGSNDSYLDSQKAGQFFTSTPSQTAWALLGLMAAGEVNSQEVRSGIDYLVRTQGNDGLWDQPWFNAPGFPRVFYLKYHGYAKYFPLWALARFNAMTRKTSV